MKWYLKVLKQYADFNGRARRKEYWMYALFTFIVFFATASLDILLFGGDLESDEPPMLIFTCIYLLGTIIPNLALSVRRLHDSGQSGWMFFVKIIPFIGGIWFFILMVTNGQTGSNKYGPDPKVEGTSAPDIEGTV